MNDSIKMIAERLKGLREIMEISVEEAAETCGISLETYVEYEKGEKDIPVSVLYSMANAYDFELTTLLTGEEPLMNSYSVTRKGRGIVVDRRESYKYQALAGNFKGRKAEPFIVTVEPKETDKINLHGHNGQEFNYILEGRLLIVIDKKELVLEEGDSIYFDSTKPHGMRALDGKNAVFFALILE
ncbi:MAG: cupin domain-containing protein [Spirochaetes bacterium]|nr:cupin domain-containing protein [Spirochaetota bacterium]